MCSQGVNFGRESNPPLKIFNRKTQQPQIDLFFGIRSLIIARPSFRLETPGSSLISAPKPTKDALRWTMCTMQRCGGEEGKRVSAIYGSRNILRKRAGSDSKENFWSLNMREKKGKGNLFENSLAISEVGVECGNKWELPPTPRCER